MIMQEHVDGALDVLDKNMGENTAFLWTGGSEAQVIAHMLLSELGEDVTFITVDTGNQFESVYDFREEFADEHNFEWHVRQNDRVLDIIQDEDDERGYHGEGPWSIEESCGSLKVEPMRDFIQEDGYTTLITGMKRADPTVDDDLSPVVERREPATHTRVNPLYNWSEQHVWAYIKKMFVPYPDCYDEGYRHTDSKCCTDDDDMSEHDTEGFDKELSDRKDKLQEMGYV